MTSTADDRRDAGPVEAVAEWLDREPDEVWEVWEPWQPQIGDRVRVRLNGECELRPYRGSRMALAGLKGHYPGEDGLTGIVVQIERADEFLARQGHRYEIEFEGGVLDLGGGGWGALCNYAASELIPISDPAAHAPSSEEAGR